MKKLFLLTLLCGFAFSSLFAQDKMETDRPGESRTPKVVSKATFITEAGFRKDYEGGKDYTIEHPEILLRYGVLDKAELRIETAAETQRLYSKNDFRYGLKPVELGLKAQLFETKNEKFTAGFIGHIGIPGLAAAHHKPAHPFHRIRALFESEITDKIKLEYNIGTDWNSEEGEQNWVYTLTPLFTLSDKWDLFLEEFSYLHKGKKPQHILDGGLAYYLHKNIKVDLSGGIGLNTHSPETFIAAGISVRAK